MNRLRSIREKSRRIPALAGKEVSGVFAAKKGGTAGIPVPGWD